MQYLNQQGYPVQGRVNEVYVCGLSSGQVRGCEKGGGLNG